MLNDALSTSCKFSVSVAHAVCLAVVTVIGSDHNVVEDSDATCAGAVGIISYIVDGEISAGVGIYWASLVDVVVSESTLWCVAFF